MKTRHGFTLIELLVVISIIALLLSIMLPSLRMAKEQARSLVCCTNLKQWGIVAALYNNENHDSYWTGHYGQTNPDETWIHMLGKYYETPKLLLCPAASQLSDSTVGGPRMAWYYTTNVKYCKEGDYGSYGENSWVINPPEDFTMGSIDGLWRKRTNITMPSQVPLFGDCQFPVGFALDSDRVPTYNGEPFWGAGGVGRFCMKRHGSGMNFVFVDGSADQVRKLKNLWALKWSKIFNTGNIPADEEFIYW